MTSHHKDSTAVGSVGPRQLPVVVVKLLFSDFTSEVKIFNVKQRGREPEFQSYLLHSVCLSKIDPKAMATEKYLF